MFVFINGKIVPIEQAKISVQDRSYLYGEGVFESFRSYNGQIPHLTEHLQRLEWSATFLGIPFPEVDFLATITALLEKSALTDARLKIVLSRAGEETNLTVFCEALDEKNLVKPYKLKTARTLLNDAQPLAALKTTNYLLKTLARHEAKDGGFDDAILLNAKGNVTEATSGNLFWVSPSGVLQTVIDSEGLLRGVTKTALLKLLKEKNLVCHEMAITPQEISSAREVFLTNSVVGIKPVVAIDHRQISGSEPGSVTLMIRDLWASHIKKMSQN